ncbi:MAG: ABC transporter permease [Puniceicoccaceae bacterium]|nr:MAG: ABC transporter permease [Puniceicoccaceae bacterium]
MRSRPWLLLLPGLLWLGAFFLLPLAIIAVVAVADRGAPVAWGFGWSAFGRLWDPLVVPVLWRSAWIAAAATLGCLAIGYPLSYFIVRRPKRSRRLWYFLVLIPLAANSLVLLYAWTTILRPAGLLENLAGRLGLLPEAGFGLLWSPPAIIIGLVYWYLPFMVYPVYASMERFDFRLLEAAADLGAGVRTSVVRVLWPQTLPGVVTGCLLVYMQTFCSFVVPDLLGGAKTLMVGNLIQQRFLSLPQDWPLGAALALAVVAALAVVVWISMRVQSRLEG